MSNDKIILKSQQRFSSDHHRVYTEEVNKTALSSNDDKRIQTYDKITTYPYGTPDIKVCESEMLSKNKLNRFDEDKNTPKVKDKDKDKTIPKTKTKTKDMDKTIPKTKIEDKDMLDKINTKISNKIKFIYESICELQDDICNDNSWLRLVELNKIDAIIDDGLNVT